MNVQRCVFSILMLAAVAWLTPSTVSAQSHYAGFGHGGRYVAGPGYGVGSAGHLWSGWCGDNCGSCDTGCGRRCRLFGGCGLGSGCCGLGMGCCGLGAGCCNPSDAMGWNLNSGAGCCGFGQGWGCCRTRCFDRCGGWGSHGCGGCGGGGCCLFKCFHRGRHQDCGTCCPTECCEPSCSEGSCCGRHGLFSGRFRLCCSGCRLFQSPRRDSGYCGCNADTCGCLGESFYQDSTIEGGHYQDNSQLENAPTLNEAPPEGSHPYDRPPQPNQLQEAPARDGGQQPNALPTPNGINLTNARRA